MERSRYRDSLSKPSECRDMRKLSIHIGVRTLYSVKNLRGCEAMRLIGEKIYLDGSRAALTRELRERFFSFNWDVLYGSTENVCGMFRRISAGFD